MLREYLSRLGLTEKETDLYLVLLERGKMSPTELSKITRISRPTVYSVAKELVKKGLLIEDLGSPTLLLCAKKPEDLMTVINREQKKLDEKKHVVEQTIAELQKVARHAKYSVPKIVFIPEEELHDYLFTQTPTWNMSILSRDAIFWGFQDHTFAERYKDYIDWYWQKSTSEKLSLRLLSNASGIEELLKNSPYTRRHVRYWKPGNEFSTSTWICGDYVVMLYTKSRPHYLVEIHDRMFAENLRLIFKGIWEMLDTGKKNPSSA